MASYAGAMPPLPCAELHLHIEGTLEPDLVFALAARNGITLPYADAADLATRYAFTDLKDFLDLYYATMDVLRTEEDFADMTRAYLRRAAAAGVRHAEIMMDPQAHLAHGISLETCVNGVASVLATSEAEFGISTFLIAAFLRDRPAEEALDVLRELIRMRAPIIGIGLDSAETGYPPSLFAEVYDVARAAGLKCVAHAGEEGPPSYIWEALDALQADRIDHGIRCLEDETLVERLLADRVPLTVCPLSNVRLGAVDTMGDHPLPRMLARGLIVSVNSDDPAYFGGYVDDNVAAVTEAFGFGPDELETLAANSIRSSFLDAGRQEALLAEIASWRATSAAG